MNSIFIKYFGKNEESICSGIFSDILDQMGYPSQVIANWSVNKTDLSIFGLVRTIKLEEIETENEEIELGLGFIEKLNENEILVVKGSNKFAYFGELMTRLSIRQGINGVIIDGLTRDTKFTHSVDFPVFSRGHTPVDIKGRGRVEATDVTIDIDGVLIKPGDHIYGDNDAVVVIPGECMEDLSKHAKIALIEEKRIKKLIDDGYSITHIISMVKSF